MTQRRLDLVLLAGIGVLLLVILGLALSPAPTVVGDISDPALRTRQTNLSDRQSAAAASADSEETDSEEAEAAPAETSSGSDSGNAGPAAATVSPPVNENAAENAATESAVAEVQERGTLEETPAQNSAAAEATARPAEVPTAGIPVERVGFAYATGSEGACGVPLTAWNYVAVSRDLLEAYPCGTAVTLTLTDEVAGRSSVTAQVGDTMGADITDTVNVFVGQAEPALEYGVTRGTLAQ